MSRIFLIAAALSFPGAALSAETPPSGGTISIQVEHVEGEDGSVDRVFVEAATEALTARGFTVLEDQGHAAYVAELTFSREEVGTARAKASEGGAAVLPGGSAGVGVGLAIPFSTGKSRLVSLQRTFLGLRLRRRGEEKVAWHGAAVTVRASGVPEGFDARVASDLTEALLRSYPEEPVDIVGVP